MITNGQQNVTGYSNSRVDELFKQGSDELDDAKRKQVYDQMQAQVATDLPEHYLYAVKSVDVFSRKVQGVVTHKGDRLDYNDALLSWVRRRMRPVGRFLPRRLLQSGILLFVICQGVFFSGAPDAGFGPGRALLRNPRICASQLRRFSASENASGAGAARHGAVPGVARQRRPIRLRAVVFLLAARLRGGQ